MLVNNILVYAFSVVAFLSFQFNTDEVIISNLPAGPIRITVSMLFLSSCFFSYALTSYPIIEYLLQKAVIQNISAKISGVLISAAVRITLVLVTVLLAALLPHYALIVSLTSSLLFSLDVFIFPSTVHLKLKYHELTSHQVLLDLFYCLFLLITELLLPYINSIFHYYSLIHYDEGLTLETSVFESFTVANLPYRACGLIIYFSYS